MGISLCNLRIRTGHADNRNACLFKGIRTGDGYAGAVRTKNNGRAGAYQGSRRGRRLIVRGLIIYNIQLHRIFLAADLHGRSYVIRVLDTQGLLLAACAVVAGRRLKYANRNHIAASRLCSVRCCLRLLLTACQQRTEHRRRKQHR